MCITLNILFTCTTIFPIKLLLFSVVCFNNGTYFYLLFWLYKRDILIYYQYSCNPIYNINLRPHRAWLTQFFSVLERQDWGWELRTGSKSHNQSVSFASKPISSGFQRPGVLLTVVYCKTMASNSCIYTAGKKESWWIGERGVISQRKMTAMFLVMSVQ